MRKLPRNYWAQITAIREQLEKPGVAQPLAVCIWSMTRSEQLTSRPGRKLSPRQPHKRGW